MKHEIDWNVLKGRIDLVRYVEQVLGLKPVAPGRYNCPWRQDSDSGAFAVTPEGYYDHVTKEGGDAIRCIAMAQFGGSDLEAMRQAADWAAEWVGMAGAADQRKALKTRTVVATYVYRTAAGAPLFRVVRYEPKSFSQERWDAAADKFVSGLGETEPVLYRLNEWVTRAGVAVVEGEKDAETLWTLGIPATTAPMGAGKWKPTYTEALRGKKVVVFRDNDEPGRLHAELVCRALAPVVAGLKLLNVSDEPKGDVTDWYEASKLGPTKAREALWALVLAAPAWTDAAAAPPPADPLELAKVMNKQPFANYRTEQALNERGKLEETKVPKTVRELVKEVHERFLDFPRRVGSNLFDADRDRGDIRYLWDSAALFAWIGEKSKHAVNWAKFEGCVGREELHRALMENARAYQAISAVPSYPPRLDVYYTHGEIPRVEGRDGHYLDKLLGFFSPATPEDAALIRAFFAAPLYYRTMGKRPLWVIDSTTGQASGKTTLVEMLALLYGGTDPEAQAPLRIQFHQLQSDGQTDRIYRRVMSESGRRKRIFLLDNVTGLFKCDELSELVTASSISGMAPYGKREETRPNDLTFVVTANTATLSKDLAGRSLFIYLVRPRESLPAWSRAVADWIEGNRMEIIADVIAALQRQVDWQTEKGLRFESFDYELLRPMIAQRELYERVAALQEERRVNADVDREEADAIRDRMVAGLRALGMDPDVDAAWLRSEVVTAWTKDAVDAWRTITQSAIMSRVRNLAKVGSLGNLAPEPHRWGYTHAERVRGVGWNWEFAGDGPRIVEMAPDGKGTRLALRVGAGGASTEGEGTLPGAGF